MAQIAYYRVSTTDQSIEAQRSAMGGSFDEEFSDIGVSGAVPAALRPGFAKLLAFIRKGDTLHVYAVDRLGRDALDVQAMVRALLDKGVEVDVQGLGRIAKGVGELILAVLAQVADMERHRINERTAAGRDAARKSLAETGLTHKGKASLGRPVKGDAKKVVRWRMENGASIAATAAHWGLSLATVKRYCLSGTASV
ncbi:recombinase family protein [Variovorax sp. PAMC26660]|uniref:recombinase family protein n=1 Tax=Variovorax sp. PAMC26660 TaxID=2762322 RepID=UPI00164DB48A|nr:recombinase family protein [Variovorax sp. PAMC26660]QNK70559.1 recombinase family protein [Variovorax sp. PAMC26660]